MAETDTKKLTALDPRIDKLISWGLGASVTVVLAIGSYFVHGFEASLTGLRADAEAMRKDSDVRTDELKKEIANLRLEIAGLKPMQGEIGDLKKTLERLEDRVLRLERGK